MVMPAQWPETGAAAESRITSWIASAQRRIGRGATPDCYGRIEQVSATLIAARLPRCEVGHLCEVPDVRGNRQALLAEAVGFDSARTLLAPLGSTQGLAPGALIRSLGHAHEIVVGTHLFGQILDGFGQSLVPASAPPCRQGAARPVMAGPPLPTARPRIAEPLPTGIRTIDALTTLGRGQRIGLLAGPGCGKTTLLGALARGVAADAVVFALVGERGRELNEFIEGELDPALLARSIVVCATSDRSPMERVRAPFTATAIAEGLREAGAHVLLLVDSLTRTARAQREIGLAAGEPPGRLGFPPSVYSMLPRLIERAGPTARGAITAVYTVLTESDTTDVVGEEARSLLDGHIVLSRELAERGQFPAIDVLASISRTMPAVADDAHRQHAARMRALLARYRDLQLLVALGEYEAGHDEHNDDAVARQARIVEFQRQDLRTPCAWQDTLERLHAAVCA